MTPLHRNVYLPRQLSFTGLLLSVPGGALRTPVAAFPLQPFHPLGPQRGNVNLLKAHSTKGVSYRDQKGTGGGGGDQESSHGSDTVMLVLSPRASDLSLEEWGVFGTLEWTPQAA